MHRLVTGLLLLAALLLSGCWDRREINDLALVTMVGIDKAPEGVQLTVRVAVPQRDQSKITSVCYTVEGETVMDAVSRLQEKVSRRIFWGHARMLVFGEEYARAGVQPSLDYWSRHREPRLQMHMAVAVGKAQDLLTAEPKLERLLTESIRETINLRIQARVTVSQFLLSLRKPGEHPVLPRLTVDLEDQDVVVGGTGIFQHDRLIGWLDDAETRGLLWLRNEIETGTVTVLIPAGGHATLQVIRGRTQVRPVVSEGQLRLSVHVFVEDDLLETSAPVDFGKEEPVRVVEELLERDIRRRVEAVLAKVQQELRTDVLKFGDAVRRGAPVLWERKLKHRWDDVFPRVPVDVTVTGRVRGTGAHSQPLYLEREAVGSRRSDMVKPKE